MQKSVCVICRAPLFGRLAVKMELVVRAWFLQGDFSQTKLLEDAFKHLNSCPVQLDQTLEGTYCILNMKAIFILLISFMIFIKSGMKPRFYIIRKVGLFGLLWMDNAYVL